MLSPVYDGAKDAARRKNDEYQERTCAIICAVLNQAVLFLSVGIEIYARTQCSVIPRHKRITSQEKIGMVQDAKIRVSCSELAGVTLDSRYTSRHGNPFNYSFLI